MSRVLRKCVALLDRFDVMKDSSECAKSNTSTFLVGKKSASVKTLSTVVHQMFGFCPLEIPSEPDMFGV